jgi:hypothetical protein
MDAPEAPDPQETAAAQAAINKETAIAQKGLNSSNQITPYGSLTWNQIGTWEDGTPRYESTVNLTPEQQQLFNLQTQTQTNLGNLGVEQSAKIRELLGTPVDMSNEAVESRLFDLGSQRLNPMFAERESQLRNDLLNRGIREGTAAWDSEMRNFNQGRNDAFNNLALTGRSQAMQELLTERNQPINEITALLSGSQVTQPTFSSEAQTPVSGVDYAGLVSNNYNNEMAGYNSMMGGLAGLGGSLIGGWGKAGFPMPSDRRLKRDSAIVGKLANGLNVWAFRYKGSEHLQLGLMADEVKQLHPDAITVVDGYDWVDYAKAVR